MTIPTTDLAASVDFWTRGMDFFELFSVPGQLVHLRRWPHQGSQPEAYSDGSK
ncbi:hypothetical protein [Kocuria sp. HSID16901]|uniref:hypothetical protein n=1 Tax=Kocuria sp. HSID16901 TaxID=2419505 RepID=UPI002AA5945B